MPAESLITDSNCKDGAGVMYRYQLGAIKMVVSLERDDGASLRIVCPTCLRRAVSEAECVLEFNWDVSLPPRVE